MWDTGMYFRVNPHKSHPFIYIYIILRGGHFVIYCICCGVAWGLQAEATILNWHRGNWITIFHMFSNDWYYYNRTWLNWHDGYLIRNRNWLPFMPTWVQPRFHGGVSVVHIFSFYCCRVLYCCFFSLCFRVRPMSCIPNIASCSGLSVSDCPFLASLASHPPFHVPQTV